MTQGVRGYPDDLLFVAAGRGEGGPVEPLRTTTALP